MIVGYPRVSTVEHNPDHRIHFLIRAGVNRAATHVDHAGGAKAGRPPWDVPSTRVLSHGDTLQATRLGRSVPHLVALGAEPREQGVEHGIDRGTAGIPA